MPLAAPGKMIRCNEIAGRGYEGVQIPVSSHGRLAIARAFAKATNAGNPPLCVLPPLLGDTADTIQPE